MPAMQLQQPKPVTRFFGLNTRTDAVRLGLAWLQKADNVDITDTGAMVDRQGYSLASAGTFSAAYATQDGQRLYTVESGVLCAVADGFVRTPLIQLRGAGAMSWAEANADVLYANGVDAGILRAGNEVAALRWDVPDMPSLAAVTGSLAPGLYRVCTTAVLDDGRETGPSDISEIQIGADQALQVSGVPADCRVYIAPADSTTFSLAGIGPLVWNSAPAALGRELRTDGMDPLPDGVELLAVWRGRLYASQYDASSDQSVIWKSQPLGYHLFDLTAPILIAGRVTLLADTSDALLVGTDREIHALTADGLLKLAPYGVIPGQQAARDGTDSAWTRYFWTAAGLCRAMPFENLTLAQVSVAPGLRCAGALIEAGGQKRFVASLQAGGTAYNQVT